jgi:hypothetical protein
MGAEPLDRRTLERVHGVLLAAVELLPEGVELPNGDPAPLEYGTGLLHATRRYAAVPLCGTAKRQLTPFHLDWLDPSLDHFRRCPICEELALAGDAWG